MVITHKDIFFADIPGVNHGECHLDLYLPDKSYGQTVSKQDLDENTRGDFERYDRVEEVETVTMDKTYNLRSRSRKEKEYLKSNEYGGSYVHTESKRTRKDSGSEGSGVPFVIFIHGGGWRRGGRAAWKHYLYFDVNFLVAFLQYFVGSYGNIGETLAENNIACAVISYPLTEAGPLTLLVEILLSYIQSVFFVLIVCLPILGLTLFYKTVFQSSPSVEHEQIFKESTTLGILRTFCTLSLLLTNISTSVLFILKRRQYKISISQIRWFSVMYLASVIAASYSNKQEYVLLVLTIVLNQSMIFYLRSQRHGSTYDQQIQAVAQAVRWAKCFSKDTGHTDENRLYLMGHSAGGHLATLSALDESILASVDCSIADVKGIISISGVYDLLCLNKHWLRPVYLEPTFGKNCTTWIKASPEHLAKTIKKPSNMPKFLIMLAEKDLFLRSQSFQFAQTLEELQYDCQHVEIYKTNHFNIVTKTSTDRGTALSYVLDFVK